MQSLETSRIYCTCSHHSLNAVRVFLLILGCCSTKSIPNPSVFVLLLGWVCRFLPAPLLRLMRHLPMRRYIHFRRSLDTLNEYSRTLIEEKSAALFHGTKNNKRDVMNILGGSRLFLYPGVARNLNDLWSSQ